MGLRGWTQAPILVLSAREGQAAKVARSTLERMTTSSNRSA